MELTRPPAFAAIGTAPSRFPDGGLTARSVALDDVRLAVRGRPRGSLAGRERRLAEPLRPHRLADECPDRWRVRPAAHRDEIDLPPELGVDSRARHHIRADDAELRHEAEAEAGRDHRQDPVVPLAA